jgi:protein-S-isoprenylcysteine O-methyltransferase Ste14
MLATIGSVLWFALAAGVGVVWVPWLITAWRVAYSSSSGWRAAQALGVVLIVAGLAPIVWTFVSFVRAGGTPIPGVYTQELVVRGFNQYVRNPIYLGVVVIVVGQALLLGQWQLLVYAACVRLGTAWFVRAYEEPALARRFGAQYQAYRRAVPAWRPRVHPWSGS